MFKKLTVGMLFLGAAALVFAGPAGAGFKYVGADKCKTCHNTQAMGKMYDKWMQSAHAKAYATLASDTAKAVAKKMGIDDPQKSEKCLKCHTTDYEAHKAQAPDMAWVAEGIGCEQCHGPGEKYKALSVMKDKKLSMQNGLIVPDEKTCLKCHGNPENPFNKPFVFAEAYKKIEHRKPKTGTK
ncbi:MAG TPA: cytochrome c family protein [Verrucomicrobiae bacterium]|nr:cytochrome c family protein [Verrucomicrobiae bacterium]